MCKCSLLVRVVTIFVTLQKRNIYIFVGLQGGMVFISKKVIHGKTRLYVERSFRLPDGQIKKVSKYIRGIQEMTYGGAFLTQLEVKTRVKFANTTYGHDNVLTTAQVLRLEEMRVGYFKLLKKLTPKQFQDIVDRFTINFTYESNAIEGNSLTLKDVTMILHEMRAPGNVDMREVYETRNTRVVVEKLFNNELAFSEKDIVYMHELLVKETGVKMGYKQLPNFLLGRIVETTPPEKVRKEMKELFDWYVNERRIHPVVKAALFHGRFEKIHPFEDGNGRAGRMLLNLVLLKEGYPPLIIRKTQRVSYFAALQAFDNGHDMKLKRFILEKQKETYVKFFQVYEQYL